MKRTLSGMVLLLLACGSANAALLSRAGGQAYYDDVLNITWLADANLADTNDFGVAGINANGTMTWDKAQEWIGAMNTANYLGTNTWRLPTVDRHGHFRLQLCLHRHGLRLQRGSQHRRDGAHVLQHAGQRGVIRHQRQPDGLRRQLRTTGLTNTGPFSNLRALLRLVGYYLRAQSQLTRGTSTSQRLPGRPSLRAIGFYAWAVSPGDSLRWFRCLERCGCLVRHWAVLGLLRRKVLNRDGLGALPPKRTA